MLEVSAEANTSAGAPSRICWARDEEAPKLSSTPRSGWAVSKASAKFSKASVNDAAAKTRTGSRLGSLGLPQASVTNARDMNATSHPGSDLTKPDPPIPPGHIRLLVRADAETERPKG